jgi:hypothetical protein
MTIVVGVFAYYLVQKEQVFVYKTNTSYQVQTKITAEKALEIVSNLPEVKQWEKLFTNPDGTSPKTGGKPVVVYDSETNTTYVIHVYEDMPDHTATFGWYDVDKNTGIVTKENL